MKLFVGGLSYRMSDQELQQLFAEHGQVDEAIIATDRETHQSRGFGFVTMPNDAQGRRAIDQLNETMYDGRRIRVEISVPKPRVPRESHERQPYERRGNRR